MRTTADNHRLLGKIDAGGVGIRLLAAFYVFLAVPQGDDPFIYAKQAVGIMRGSDEGQVYFCPPGRSYCLIPFFLAFGESETTCRANAVAFDVACVLVAAAWPIRFCAAAPRRG